MTPSPMDSLFAQPERPTAHTPTSPPGPPPPPGRLTPLRNAVAALHESVPWNALAVNVVIGAVVTAPLYPLPTLGERAWLASLFIVALSAKLATRRSRQPSQTHSAPSRWPKFTRILDHFMYWASGALAGVTIADVTWFVATAIRF